MVYSELMKKHFSEIILVMIFHNNTFRALVFEIDSWVTTKGKSYLHLSFSTLEFILFFSAFFLIGLKWARTRTKSGKFTISFSLAPPNFPPSSSSLFDESRKNACTILSPKGLMASSGILRKSSLVRWPFCCLSKLVNRLHNRSIWFEVTVIN